MKRRLFLDLNHNYNYRSARRRTGSARWFRLPTGSPARGRNRSLCWITIRRQPAERGDDAKAKESATPDIAQVQEFESPLLTRFWGRSTKIGAWVILPPAMRSTRRKPIHRLLDPWFWRDLNGP